MYGLSNTTVQKMVSQNTPIDEIISIHEDRDYFEVTGSAGGDILTYRFYENGQVTER